MLSEQQVRLEAEDLVVDWLVHEGYDPVYGARPLRRTLQVRQALPLTSQHRETFRLGGCFVGSLEVNGAVCQNDDELLTLTMACPHCGVCEQSLVLNPLASAILEGKVLGGDMVELKVVTSPLPSEIVVAREQEGGRGEAVVMRVKRPAKGEEGDDENLPAVVKEQ